MTRDELFWTSLVTVVMWSAAAREFHSGNRRVAVLMFAIPLCGWLAIFFGR